MSSKNDSAHKWLNLINKPNYIGSYSEVPLYITPIKMSSNPRYWPVVRGIHRSPVNSPHKGHWRGAFFICYMRLNKQSSKQLKRRWFETTSSLIWRHCNVCTYTCIISIVYYTVYMSYLPHNCASSKNTKLSFTMLGRVAWQTLHELLS